MTSYVCSLDLPPSWFEELARRVPGVRIHAVAADGPPPPSLLAETDVLHTGDWFPDAGAMPSLRLVQLDTSGVDHVRTTSLWHADVPIATIGGIAPVPMAEFAMMSMLELAHRMPRIQRLRDERRWPTARERLDQLTPAAIAGSTMGIVGYGRIGREIARLARAFGVEVLGVRRSTAPVSAGRFDTGRSTAADDQTQLFPMERLSEVLRRSDILVIVVPLTELTRGLIDAAALDLLPPGAMVINIARGGIVHETALLERLRDGRIGGVALDVFDDEPLSTESPWWSEPGALVTPHVAGLAPMYQSQILDLVVENLTRLAEGRPVLNEVDRESGY